MQLEHILQAHGLIGRDGKGETQLPEITNFIATSELDGLGISLEWKNSILNEYMNTIIFMSVTNLNVADYDYCVANATEILDTSTLEEFIVKNITPGTKYYFKAFMKFNTLGEIRISKGATTSAIAPHLPSVISFTATSKEDGSGVNLNWTNSAMAEYLNTEIFVNINNIFNESRDYCLANATKIVDSNIFTSFTYEGVTVGTTYYFKIFMSFNIDGQTKWNDGRSANATAIDIIPPATITNLTAKGDDTTVELNWTNPADSDFSKVKIMYKQGGYPTSYTDGTLAYEGSGTSVTVTGLTNDVEYYFRAFTFDTSGNINSDIANQQIMATPSEIKIYGVEIDESNSNPETAVVYTNDAVGFTPASGNNGAFNWGSWESIIKDEFKIRPCVLNNPAKTVNYYLNYDNYNLKATGEDSVLTGVDGDIMIEFGTDIYTKWTVVGSKHKIQFSIKPFEGAIKNAFETEDGYNQFVYYPLLLTQKLYLLLFKNRDSQTALGRGYVDGNSSYATTGNTNTKGFMFGETTGKQQMKFLGIEDYWGNKYQWIDGLVTDASFNILIGNSNFNDTGSGYTSHASGISANTSGYIDTVQGGNDKGFMIKSKSGSGTTHYCDYGYLDSWRVACFGGGRSEGAGAGFAGLGLGRSGSRAATIGSRLFCKNNGKLYIGAYLGTTQGGKLRSVSGTTPSDNKTIDVFRNEAKANNN